jgi:hypothetical protein
MNRIESKDVYILESELSTTIALLNREGFYVLRGTPYKVNGIAMLHLLAVVSTSSKKDSKSH